MYTGTETLEVESEAIDTLYKDKKIKLENICDFSQNQYLVLTSPENKSAIARVKGEYVCLINTKAMEKEKISGVVPRNKEQFMAMDALLDDSIRVCTLTGKAGTGKTLLTMAAALHKADKKVYNKIILTRPMSQVGKNTLGALPGDVDEKFNPYLQNYMCNFEHLVGGRKDKIASLIALYNMEFIPLQLIRGASWANAFIIADEVQVMDFHEMLTLGTRVGENSKIVIMGDLGQRDEKIAKDKTGLFKFVNHKKPQNSPLVASIHLMKSERSAIVDLFCEVFETQ